MTPSRFSPDTPTSAELPTGRPEQAKVSPSTRVLVIHDEDDLAEEIRNGPAHRASGTAALRVLGPGAGGSGARVPTGHDPWLPRPQPEAWRPSARLAGLAALPPSSHTEQLRPVSTCKNIMQATAMMAEEGPFDVVVAGPSTATPGGLEHLRILHESSPQTALVLAFPKDQRPRDPHLSTQSLVRTGAIDLVYIPAAPGELTRAVEHACTVATVARREVSVFYPAPVAKVATAGTVITLASATGGCGKTFLASNLACFFASHGRRTCILDLDLQFGEVSTALQLRPQYTIADVLALRVEDQAELAEHFEEYLVRHDTGTWVLAAPRDPSEADTIAPSEVGKVIEVAKMCFDVVIVDTPAALTEVVLAAFDRSDLLYAVTTLDTPSIRNLGLFIHTLERLKIPSENVRLVLNKAEQGVGIEVDQVTRLFSREFSAVLPYAREVSRSINIGQPVIASAPGSEIAKLLVSGFNQLLDSTERADAQDPVPTGRRRQGWRRWLR